MWQVQYTCSWVNYIMINWNHNEVSKRLWSHWKWSFFHRLLKVTKYSKSTTGLQSHTIRAWVLTSTVIDGKKTCAYRYPSLQVSWILNDRSCRLFIGRTRKGGVSKLHTTTSTTGPEHAQSSPLDPKCGSPHHTRSRNCKNRQHAKVLLCICACSSYP